jgi:hypothetical protein
MELVEGKTDTTAAFGELSPEERRRLGRLGGFLMLVGSLFSFPAGLFLEVGPEPHEHLVGLTGIGIGIGFILAPWERLSSHWLHAIPILGGIEIAMGVGIFSDDYAFYYVLLAVYAAYVVRELNVLVAYMGFFTILLFAPLLYMSDGIKEQMHHILVTFPVFVTCAVVVRYLRDTLERREERYREFAREAVGVALRLRGDKGATALDERLEELSRESEPVGSGSGRAA